METKETANKVESKVYHKMSMLKENPFGISVDYEVANKLNPFLDFTVSPCILIHQVLFTPTLPLFHTTMYQSFKLY